MGVLIKLLLKRLRELLEETGGISITIVPITEAGPPRRLARGRKAMTYIT